MTTTPANTEKTKSVSKYFKGVKSEMKKVIWPSKKELISYTGVVVMMSAIVALIVWALDFLVLGGIDFIIK